MKSGGLTRSFTKLTATLVAVTTLIGAEKFWQSWGFKQTLSPSGGLYFPVELRLEAPRFAQNDLPWANDHLGPTNGTMAAEGCAVTSAAMALGFYGVKVNPGQLNEFLTANDGYTPQGWIYWEAAAEFEPGKVRHAYEDLPSYRLIDWNLLRKNPVIIRIRRPSGGTHFVLLIGKRGYEYLAQDPGSGGRIINLSALESQVEALRFYQRL